MNNKFISNSVNFIFAFCWLIFFSVFAFVHCVVLFVTDTI